MDLYRPTSISRTDAQERAGVLKINKIKTELRD
jgi:hypothetical protein